MSDRESDEPQPSIQLRRFGKASDVLGLSEDGGADAAKSPCGIEEFARQVGSEVESGADSSRVEERAETWITYRLGAELYALPVTHVSEIARMVAITRVPEAPSGVRGIANIRGRVLTVVDLKERLALGSVEEGPETRILVSPWRNLLIGLLVDQVERVIEIRPSEVQRGHDGDVELNSCVQGVISDAETFVILLDPDEILAGASQVSGPPEERRSA